MITIKNKKGLTVNQMLGQKLLYVLILASITVFSSQAYSQNAAIQAPPWQLSTQSGKAISLEQFKGKPIILHFWATWCPYCKKIQPKLVELQKEYQDDNVKLVAISFNEDEGALPQNSITDRGFNFITAINGERVAALYGVRGTPTTFFINKKGEVIYKSVSADINDPNLALAMKEIIK